MSGWKEHAFGDLVDFPPKIQLKKGEEYPFIDMDIVKPENRYVTNQQLKKYDSSGSAKFADGDVLLARITPCLENGKIAQVKISKGTKGFGSTEFFVFRAKVDLLDQNFLFYLSKSDLIWKNAVNSMVGASGRQRADASFLKKVKFNIPDLNEQRKISAILTAYDDLIESNQQRITLIDRMAEELYREWFVRLRYPGYKKFKVVKGLPEGWQVKTLGEIVEYYIGGGWGEDDQSAAFSEEGYVIRGTDIPHIQKGKFTVCPFRFHKPSNLKSRKLQPNDFVFEVSGGSTNQLLGRNIHITESFLKFFDAPVIAASFCKLIRFRQDQVSSLFMKYFMKLYYDCDLVGIYQIQSTGISNYQFESFLKYQTIVLPPKELQKTFDELITPALDMRDKIALANIQLKKSLDLLLPRLISGKLSVEHLDIQFPPSMLDEAGNPEVNQTKQ